MDADVYESQMMELPRYLDIETNSLCNRVCPTCLRNSHPDREALKSWFKPHPLLLNTIINIFIQAKNLGFEGGVCLSHYNEPLMDERIQEIAKLARSFLPHSEIFLNTNGDYLTYDLCSLLDGTLDKIIVSLYMKEPMKSQHTDWIASQFHRTKVEFTSGEHIATHFSPAFDISGLIQQHCNRPCRVEPITHLIINHRGRFLLCCEDVIGNYDLGTFPETSLVDYWFGEKHTKIVNDLKKDSGRLKYPYCSICPRP